LHQGRLTRGEEPLQPLDGRLVLGRVDLDQELTPLDQIAFLDAKLDDPPGDVGADVDLGLGLDLPARRDRRHQVALRDLLEPDLYRVPVAPGSGQHGGGAESDDEQGRESELGSFRH